MAHIPSPNTSLNVTDEFRTSYANFSSYPRTLIHQDLYRPSEDERYERFERTKNVLCAPPDLSATSDPKPYYVVFRDWNDGASSEYRCIRGESALNRRQSLQETMSSMTRSSKSILVRRHFIRVDNRHQ